LLPYLLAVFADAAGENKALQAPSVLAIAATSLATRK
jgi:hypothetical protein